MINLDARELGSISVAVTSTVVFVGIDIAVVSAVYCFDLNLFSSIIFAATS